jgi:hypothetical protein
MNPHLAPILVGLLVIAGCTSPGQSPSSDPFLVGQTRIPPPGTGEAAGRSADPAYSAPPPLSSPSPTPGWQPTGTAVPAGGTVAMPGAQPAATPGFATKPPDARAASDGSFSRTSGSAPPVSPTAASPPPGSPSAGSPPAGLPGGLGGSVPPSPSGGGVTYRGVSLRGSRRAAPAPEARSADATAAVSAGTSLDNRAPRPFDDGGATAGDAAAPKPLAMADAGNAASPQPTAGAAPPSASNNPPGGVTEIGDLPTAL